MPIDPLPLPNGHPLSSSTSSVPAAPPPPPEIEATLSRLSAYRNVRGVMILSRRPQSASTAPGALMGVGSAAGTGGGGGIIQSTGSVFEGEGGRKYAKALEGVVNSVARAVEECDQGDELKFMRIRTKRHELIITPDERYLLVVLQDPGQ